MAIDLFKLFGTIEIDNKNANKSLKETSEEGSRAESKLSKVFTAFGKGAAVAGKAIATGLAVGATAIAGLVAKSTQEFANYEQLIGGVETLFKNSAAKVEQYANDAFRTAGLSANEYMETVTSFSASLLQSLGGDTNEVVEYAQLAITDMADNANKMGTNIASIQVAYQGFAKQNYSMLDNLKLGYGGTAAEMYRLMERAAELDESFARTAEFSLDTKGHLEAGFADIVKAIHIVQTEMGITGTTAEEAATTISGSIAMTKSAWSNLMSGLAQDNANLPQLVDNVVSSGVTVLSNIIPVIKRIIQSIPEAISEISPRAGTAFQGMLDLCTATLPVLQDAITTTFDLISNAFNFVRENTGVLTAVATAIGVIVTALGMYNTVAAVKAAMAVAEVTTVWGLVSAYAAQAAAMAAALAPYLAIASAIAAVIAIVALCVKHWDELKLAASNAWEWIQGAWSSAASWFDTNVIQPIVAFFTGLWDSLVNIWDGICNAVSIALQLIGSIIEAAFLIITLPFQFIWENCKELVFDAFEWIKEAISTASQWVSDKMAQAWAVVRDNIITPIKEAHERAKETFENMKQAMLEKVNATKERTTEAFTNLKNKATEIFTAIREKVTESVTKLKDKATETFNNLRSKASEIFTAIKEKITTPINAAKDKVQSTIQNLRENVTEKFNSIKSKTSEIFAAIKDKMTQPIENAKDKIKEIVDTVKGFFINMTLSFPKIKLPHFSISPSGWKIGDLLEGSIPRLSIDWYARAMNNPIIMDKPTIFGYNGATGELMGGGEAGTEVVSGAGTLMRMIQTAVASQNDALVALVQTLIDMLADYFPDALDAMRTPAVFDPNMAAKALAVPMNRELGRISMLRERGR